MGIGVTLDFDWEAVQGREILSVRSAGGAVRGDVAPAYSSLVLVLERSAIVLTVNEDTDEVIVSLSERQPSEAEPWSTPPELSEVVGRRLGWCWQGWNYRGYNDTFTISFEEKELGLGITPALMFVGKASRLTCLKAAPISAKQNSN